MKGVRKSTVQDRVSSYQRGLENRHRNSEVWKRVAKFGFLSTKIQRHGPGKGFEVLSENSPPRPLGFMRSVTGTRMCHQVLKFTCSPKRKKMHTEERTNILHGRYFAPKAASFAENRFFCLPQVLRSMTRSAGDEKFKVRALLACVAGAGFFLGRRKKSRGRATQARAL